MRIAFIADEITTFIKDHDSTWALMQAAFELGDEVYYANASSLKVITKSPAADLMKLDQEFFSYQSISKAKLLELPRAADPLTMNLDEFDLVFMRKDPPVDINYLNACQILGLCRKALVVNDPNSIIKFNEKLSTLNFPELIPLTLVSRSLEEIKKFLTTHKKIVIKPIDQMGGRGVFLIDRLRNQKPLLEQHAPFGAVATFFNDVYSEIEDFARRLLELGDQNTDALIDTATNQSTNLVIVQEYLPEIKTEGDKRIIMINGKPAGAILRIPPANDFRANLAAGGSCVKYDLTDKDIELCKKLEAFLVENGIYLAGIDVIGNKLTEINITSPTCLQEINRSQGLIGEDKLEFVLMKELKHAKVTNF